jgi:hypothetical protein
MLSVRVVRTLTLVVCGAGIAGMIVTSILDHNGAAVTFGLITAVAVLCSMVAKAVAADTEHRLGRPPLAGEDDGSGVSVDVLADLVERQVQDLVAGGADEATARQLVGEAVRLGRALGSETSFSSGGKLRSRRTPHAGNV